jgi:hypothetical protein
VSLKDVATFRVPRRHIDVSEKALREAGAAGYERFVLWSGHLVSEQLFVVNSVLIPAQTAYKLSSGVCVRVDGAELRKLNHWLYENKETLAVQIHTHPTEAYHSDTDDAYPIATQVGSVSIVVPDFCRRGLLVHDSAMYRLVRGGWSEVTRSEGGRLVVVAD